MITLIKSRRDSAGFTLLELVIVIIIVGVLATLGYTQYSSLLERFRAADAKTAVYHIRGLALKYWLENQQILGFSEEMAGISCDPDAAFPGEDCCRSDQYFGYYFWGGNPNVYNNKVEIIAVRCQAGGKLPNDNYGGPARYIKFTIYLPSGDVAQDRDIPHP